MNPPPTRRYGTATDERPIVPVRRRHRRSLRSLGRSAVARLALAVVLSSLLVAAITGPAMASEAPARGDVTANGTVGSQDGLEAHVDDVMADRVADGPVPGATVAVVEGDDVVLAKGYGTADADAGTPVRANETAFRIGSVSKLVTWTAVMQGVEDGRLDLDEDVDAYLDESAVSVPDTYDEPVTLRHLGTHTAGFDVSPNPGVVTDPEDLTSIERALVENRADRVRPPGEAVGYSNYGAMLAGHVVAEAYDTSFEEYVRAEIFDPLEMDHSTFRQPVSDDHPGELAAPHDPDGTTADRTYVNWRPAGSMSATATDMAAFMSAHLGEGATGDARVLSPEAADEMHAVQHERHPAVNGWRYGFYEYGGPDDDLIAHSGATTHFTSQLVLAPEADVGVFVSFNVRSDRADPAAAADEILEAYGLPADTDPPEPASDPEAAHRSEVVAGEYVPSMAPKDGPARSMGLLMRMSVESTGDGRLESQPLLGQDRRWVETEPYVYREVDGDGALAFEVEDGGVTALYANDQPQTDFEPVPGRDRSIVVGGALGVTLLGFALSILWWVGAAARRGWRRLRSDTGAVAERTSRGAVALSAFSRFRRPAWLARAAAVALCLVSIGFVLLFLAGLATSGELAFALRPAPFRAALALPPVVATLAAATAVGSALGWRRDYWSRRTRIHQTILAVVGLLFVAQLARLGFLGV